MAKFNNSKNGYDIEQVDNYLNTLTLKYEEKLAEQRDRVLALRNENRVLNDKISEFEDKDKKISQALIVAVEKAEQIENSAKNIYELEVKRIKIIYQNWLKIIEQIQNNVSIDDEFLINALKEFNNGISRIVNKNISNKNVKDDLKKNSDNYIKNLLNKMDYVINGNDEITTHVHANKDEYKIEKRVIDESKKEKNRLNVISNKLNNLLKSKKDSNSIMESYLNSDDEENNAYTRNIARKKYAKDLKYLPNESGFDLNDALNPKEDLDEIMKAFDFFNNDEGEK